MREGPRARAPDLVVDPAHDRGGLEADAAARERVYRVAERGEVPERVGLGERAARRLRRRDDDAARDVDAVAPRA